MTDAERPADPTPDWTGLPVTVAGLGVSGISAARVLHGLGALVTVVDGGSGEGLKARAAELEALGVAVRLGDGDTLPEGTRLVVTSPGWPPSSPLFEAAARAGLDIWGDIELAWRLRRPHPATGEPAPGWPSPAPTARPPPSRCSPRS